ncbi:group II intron reverse transcriptase/maturase [Providencia sp. MGF014]|uniref:group II intron reverse transcriptase/maturase n=1 Tax=Providencia sp. MGF014 TaxID=2565573 RepID=UPI00197D018F
MMNIASAKSQPRSLPQAVDEIQHHEVLNQTPNNSTSWMAQVLARDNLIRALNQVKRNKGAAGVDGMTVDKLPDYLKQHWPTLREQLETGFYKPEAVKRVEIPKADGRKRKLGIPTVLDRFIQQAIAQILSRHWENQFHNNSYGFRPMRSAHQAITHAKALLLSGKRWVVDLDLDAFFDRVNHDRLMSKLRAQIQDPTLLGLIHRYLKAKIDHNGKQERSEEGVPQGGPLSPLLANIVLNELDWELERRGHSFARYADDCQIYTGSKRAGERIKQSIERFIETRLRLKVNKSKSALARPWERSFLGFTFSRSKGNRVKVSDKALNRLKDKLRELSRRTRGHNIGSVIAEIRKALLGWKAYFGIAEVQSQLRDTDKWLRRKLRCYIWKQWGRKGYRMLRKAGVDRYLAWNTAKSAHGPWRLSKSPALYIALPNRYFTNMGLPTIAA